MGIVIGPYTENQWLTMLDLKLDSKNMSTVNTEKYTKAITCNKNCLKEFFSRRAA